MVTRTAGTNLIQTPALPPLTTTVYLYLVYGQSNGTGSAAAELVNTSDPTYGACKIFGRDGRSDRTGVTTPLSGSTGTWADLPDTNSPPDGSQLVTFTGLPNSTAQEPNRAYNREVFFYEVAKTLNKAQIAATGQRHNCRFVTLGHTGYQLSELAKGTHAYTNAINGMTQLYNAEIANGTSASNIVIAGILWQHGEANFATSGSGYAAAVSTLATNLNADLKAITGQSGTIPMFISQQSNFCVSATYSAGTIIYPVLDQLAAHTTYPGQLILAAPMYAAQTLGATKTNDPTNFHCFGHDAVRWAHGYGNAVASVVINGQAWNPVMPRTVSRAGAVVTITFYVPVGNLVLDTSYVTNTADGNYGFDFHQTGGSAITMSPPVPSASAGGGGVIDTLTFTLSRAPDGTSPFLRAGRNPTASNTPMGPVVGARTCLRDQANNLPQYCNWCVHFDQPI